MKYVVFLGDGMADLPYSGLDNKTPLEVAMHPNLDELAREGYFGLARTVPEGMPAGSDTANLSVFGYDPEIYYSGRSPLEAVSLGIEISPDDVTYRCNTVTLSEADSIEDAIMLDYSAGEIESELSKEIIAAAQAEFGSEALQLYNGIYYRHCLVMRNAESGGEQTPPHDISKRPVRDFLPKGTNADKLLEIMKWSYKELKKHPVNIERVKKGQPAANCLWFWGEGRKPALDSYKDKFGIERGAVISAVDLIQGIGRCAGLEIIRVPGATGNYTTDFAAKGQAAIDALKNGAEFVYIHVEAADECGHHCQVKEKVWSIEQIDEKIVAPVMDYLKKSGEEYAVLAMPDHPTPLELMTHTRTPVPFALYFSDGRMGASGAECYTEAAAAKTGVNIEKACTLMELMTR